MKNLKSLFVLVAFLLIGQSAFALTCSDSRMIGGSADDCYTVVTVASNETTLVSDGTVLVYDITNAQFNANNSAYQVRVATASANGVRVAGVATRNVASGETTQALVRGKGNIAIKGNDVFASGDQVWVSTSGDTSSISSNTQTQAGFILEASAGGSNGRSTKKAYITIV